MWVVLCTKLVVIKLPLLVLAIERINSSRVSRYLLTFTSDPGDYRGVCPISGRSIGSVQLHRHIPLLRSTQSSATAEQGRSLHLWTFRWGIYLVYTEVMSVLTLSEKHFKILQKRRFHYLFMCSTLQLNISWVKLLFVHIVTLKAQGFSNVCTFSL